MLTHVSAPQISEKLSQLQARRQETADKWQEKMDWLQLGELPWGPGSWLWAPGLRRRGWGSHTLEFPEYIRPRSLGMELKVAHPWHYLALPCAPALGQ